MEPSSSIITYLDTLVQMRRSMQEPQLRDWHYCCIEQFVLENGHSYTKVIKRPKWVPKGVIKECFSNCFSAMVRHPDRLVYCEGYATGVIPVHHAWLLYDGQVIDPTWDGRIAPANQQVEYYGVAFSYDYVIRTALKTEYYGILDNFVEHYPLISGEHTTADCLYVPSIGWSNMLHKGLVKVDNHA